MLGADGDLHGDDLLAERLAQCRHGGDEVRPLAVQHVAEEDARSPRCLARAHRRSVCTSTPLTPLTTISAVSTTCRAEMVSARKLESPGVSSTLKTAPLRSM